MSPDQGKSSMKVVGRIQTLAAVLLTATIGHAVPGIDTRPGQSHLRCAAASRYRIRYIGYFGGGVSRRFFVWPDDG